MTDKNIFTKPLPLLKQIDEGLNLANTEWNRNSFQTLITSNLPKKTIFYYAIDVGLRRLENSLFETYWDVTADALNDLCQYLFNASVDEYSDNYLHEAKCQLLMYSAISIIKMNTIRRRSIHDAKMACAVIFHLLLDQKQSYKIPKDANEFSACLRSMHCRYLKRIFITVQWLSTLLATQHDEMQKNYERYIGIIVNQLFPSVSLQDKINNFIDTHFFGNDDHDVKTSDFVFVRQFPIFNPTIIDKYNSLMFNGLDIILDQFDDNQVRKLTCCIWTLCCMIESKRISLEIINHKIKREHFSSLQVDFERKSTRIESLNEQDIIIFLLLCAQQNIHIGDSTLHPYLLFSSSHLCTQQQKQWWQTAIEQTSWTEFVEHLATIRLNDDRLSQHPPKVILLETARILFNSARDLYEKYAKQTALSYEQYAKRYLQIAKTNQINQELSNSPNKSYVQGVKHDKLFFFFSTKTVNTNQKYIEDLIDECEQSIQQCDELKLLPEPEPPRTSSPTQEEEQKDIEISAILSPVVTEKEREKHSQPIDSTLFATPPSIKTRDVDVQVYLRSPSPPAPIEIALPTSIEETIEISEPPLPPYVDMIFSHMNDVNQWINRFCLDHEVMQNDINAIRDQLEKINRVTSQMMFSNVKMLPSESSDYPHGFYSSHPT